MATLTRTVLAFALGALVAGFLRSAISAFLLGDVDPDFVHQPFAAFVNLFVRHVVIGVAQSAIFGLGLLAGRFLFARKVPEAYEIAGLLGVGLVVVNYILSVVVRKGLATSYDLIGLIFGLSVPLILAFVFPMLTRRRPPETANKDA